MAPGIAIDYWRGRAQTAASRASQLDDELIALRGLASRSIGELGAVCIAVAALCDIIEAEGCSPDVVESIAGVRAAIAGKHAAELMNQLHHSYSWYFIAKVLHRMFRKMKSGPKLAKAAEKWVHEQLQRHGDASVDYRRRIQGG
jgi:hypothetical protein